MQANNQLVPKKSAREFDSEDAEEYSELDANDPKYIMDKSYSEAQIERPNQAPEIVPTEKTEKKHESQNLSYEEQPFDHQESNSKLSKGLDEKTSGTQHPDEKGNHNIKEKKLRMKAPRQSGTDSVPI